MGWWRTEWSAAARQDCQECSHARQYRNGPRFPAGTFPTVGSHREQLVFDNSFPPPRLSGEGSIHARTQTGTHGRSTTRRWPGGQGLCRCQKDARRLAPRRSEPHLTLSLGLYPTSSHLTFIRLFQGGGSLNEISSAVLSTAKPFIYSWICTAGGGGAGCSLLF